MYKLKVDLEKFSYKHVRLSEERIVLRTCLNVATDDQGKMTDSTRFYESLPLIRELALTSPNLVVLAHLGRPTNREKKFSLENVVEHLQDELIKQNVGVHLIKELNDESIDMVLNNVNGGGKRKIFVLENVRFFPEEDSKNKEERLGFAKKLASLGDIFINDAFADYRESASTYDIATILPSYLGPVFLSEVQSITKFSDPKRPFVSILGGAKLSEKLDALNSLAEVSDKVLVGGAMAYTLLKAKGVSIGKSLVEEDKVDLAKEMLQKFGDKLILPVDHLIADEFSQAASESAKTTDSQQIPEGKIAIDIGPVTTNSFKAEIEKAESILWNGPMGVFEWDKSSVGTKQVADAILANKKAYKLAGGGDSIAAINKFNLTGFDHISTGGGAMLALIAYDKFPTLDVILER